MSKAIAAINIARKELGLEEEDYRSLLHLVVGKTSLREMTAAEHGRVLDAMAARGVGRRQRALTGPYGAKLQALWISGWNLGLVRNREDEALLAFVKGQTGIDHTRFLRDAKDARKAVEALKKWLERAGVAWSEYVDPKDCIVSAQLKLLPADDRVHDLPSVKAWKSLACGDADKLALMQRLGSRIRSKAGPA